MKHILPVIAACAATQVAAEETRQLDAHEHGAGALNIAIEGTTVAMEFHAPGADIVGFEHAADSSKDRAAVDAAVATLARPLDLFLLPSAAECTVTQASAGLESEEAHDDHAGENEEHEADHKDEHEDHAAGHDDHDEHAEAHDDREEHGDETGHTEFHAEYALTCADPSAITEITFAYFEAFENARELEVQIATDIGVQAFEVGRDAPTLDLRSLF